MLLAFSLPFFYKYSTVAIALIFFLCLVEIVQTKKVPPIRVHWFLPFLFLYYTLSELLTGGSYLALQKRHLLILFPLALALSVNYQGPNLRPRVFKSFIVANLLAILICVVRAFVQSITIQDGEWIFNPRTLENTTHDFLTSSVMGGNYFFGEDFSYFQHPTYWGIQLVFAQYLVAEVFNTVGKRGKAGLIVTYFVFLGAMFLLSSKAVILTSLIVAFWILFRIRIPVAAKASAIAGCILIGTFFVFFNPRLKVFVDTFSIKQFTHPDPSARYGHDLRILSWDASIDLIREHWFAGVGEANKTPALVDVYKKKGYIVPAEQQLNSHNQYLEFLVGGGIIGFGLFMTGILNLSIMAFRDRDYVLLAFVAIIAFNSLFETLLDRHVGVLFFSVFVSFFTTRRQSLT